MPQNNIHTANRRHVRKRCILNPILNHSPRYWMISQVGALPSAPDSQLTHCLKTKFLHHHPGGRDKSDPSKQREEGTNPPLKYLKYRLGERLSHPATWQDRGGTAPPPCPIQPAGSTQRRKAEARSATHFKGSWVLPI